MRLHHRKKFYDFMVHWVASAVFAFPAFYLLDYNWKQCLAFMLLAASFDQYSISTENAEMVTFDYQTSRGEYTYTPEDHARNQPEY